MYRLLEKKKKGLPKTNSKIWSKEYVAVVQESFPVFIFVSKGINLSKYQFISNIFHDLSNLSIMPQQNLNEKGWRCVKTFLFTQIGALSRQTQLLLTVMKSVVEKLLLDNIHPPTK